MKRFLYILLFPLSLLCSCINEDEPDSCRPTKVQVEMAVRSDRMLAVSRSTDEEAIRDVNFYLYNNDGAVILHRYQTSPTLRFTAVPGVYRLRIDANMGRDLGEFPAEEAFTITHTDEYGLLPMAWEGDVTIPASGGTLPAIEVQRAVAKISYDITVKPSDIELQSVQLLSVPRTASIFDAEAALSADPDDYTDCPATTLSGRSATGISYLLPNMQGVVSSITDQRQKNPDNAPANASYLLIRATRGATVLAYYIYLGENNTSDFNVRANTCYRMNISILGDDEVDTRISSYTASVEDTFEHLAAAGYCHYIPVQRLTVKVTGGSRPPSLRGQIEVTEGDAAAFSFNGASGRAHDFSIAPGEKIKRFPIDYAPQVFTTENSRLCYRVRLTDEYGFSQQYDFSHDFADELAVYAPAGGAIRESGALYAKVQSAGEKVQTVLLCLGECRLRATPEAGYAFGGWYTDSEYTQRLSSEAEYLYRPAEKRAVLHAQFIPLDTPLDDEGTANCYIAPKLGTSYSFNATVMGNNKTTLNITPRKLSGTQARVLWETGAVRGAVIKDAEYKSGRIVFTTGSERGNAVVGLLDSHGNCIWSWHIWSVDYDIETSGQTYKSGAVFMDRNLGALTTDYTQVASRGLYYQWGRKDPFIYPATYDDNYKFSEVVYTAGFEYGVSYPESAEVELPRDVMTVAWSVAHPTIYMNGANFQDWDEWTSVSDWLYDPHPNLWGNITTGKNNISRVSYKSIYDPCPPGWKVPAAEDFVGIERISVSAPYYVTIRCNGTQTAKIPLGGTFSEGYFNRNGTLGRLYTNAPYYYRWGSGISVFHDIACTSIYFDTSNYPPFINTTDFYRYAANPVRCIRE